MSSMTSVELSVLDLLETVKDPEIDSVSVIELGMVERFTIEGDTIHIDMLPTFMGCPALEIIKANIENTLLQLYWVSLVNVQFLNNPPWTSDRVSEVGREKLKEFGIAPPPRKLEASGEWHVDCPYCDSTYTTLDNIFGPTACRSILYCRNCKNPFEAMKPISTLM